MEHNMIKIFKRVKNYLGLTVKSHRQHGGFNLLSNFNMQDDFLAIDACYFYQSNAVVNRCINLLAHNIASVNWHFVSGPTPNLANASQSWHELICQAIIYLYLYGNSYMYFQDLDIHLLHPSKVSYIKNLSGHIVEYVYCGQNISCQQVVHLKIFNPNHTCHGNSPLMGIHRVLAQYQHIERLNLEKLSRFVRPCGALSTGSERHNPEDKLNLYNYIQGLNGKVTILEGDFKWLDFSNTEVELDFLKSKKYLTLEIARAFGVPIILLGILDSASYNNYLQSRQHFWKETIFPLIQYILNTCNAKFITRIAYNNLTNLDN